MPPPIMSMTTHDAERTREALERIEAKLDRLMATLEAMDRKLEAILARIPERPRLPGEAGPAAPGLTDEEAELLAQVGHLRGRLGPH